MTLEELRIIAAIAERQHDAPPSTAAPASGHPVSQRIRKRIEEPFGWIKASAGLQISRPSTSSAESKA